SSPSREPLRGVALILVAAMAVMMASGPLLGHGALPNGSDVYSTNHYLQEFVKAFREGDPYPRWTSDTNQGLGAPAFVLLTPLAYYGAAGTSWLMGSIIGGLKLYLVLVMILTWLAFYALARQWVGPGVPSAIAASVYLVLPYHLLDVYQRFA